MTIFRSPPGADRGNWVLALWVLAIFLVFFRPQPAFRNNWGGYDDECYKAWTLKLLGKNHPACKSQSYFPGVALVWLPAGLGALALHEWRGHSLQESLAVLVGITSFLCWVGSLCLLRRCLGVGPGRALLSLLAVPVLYYATSRTALTHAAEFLLASATWYALLARRFDFALALAVWLTATRLNDAPMLLVVLGAYLDARGKAIFLRVPLLVCLTGIILLPAVFDLVWLSGYNKVPFIWHLKRFRWDRVTEVLYGSDWGLLWTAPFWLLCFGLGTWRLPRLSWAGRAAWLWMALALAFCCFWPTNGSDFAYRYLIGTYVAAFLIWKERPPSRGLDRLGHGILIANALWLTVLTLIYMTGPTVRPYHHWLGWLTPNFQWEALEALLDPETWWNAFSKSALGTTLLALPHQFPELPRLGRRSWGLSPMKIKLVQSMTLACLFAALAVGWRLLRRDRNAA